MSEDQEKVHFRLKCIWNEIFDQNFIPPIESALKDKGRRLPSLDILSNSNQVILAGTLTGVQRDIGCKVLAALSTAK